MVYTFGPPIQNTNIIWELVDHLLGALMKFSMIVLPSNHRGCFVFSIQGNKTRAGVEVCQ